MRSLERIATPPADLLALLFSPGLKRGRGKIKSLENLRDRRLTPAMPGHHYSCGQLAAARGKKGLR
jgi:hypothetical protein